MKPIRLCHTSRTWALLPAAALLSLLSFSPLTAAERQGMPTKHTRPAVANGQATFLRKLDSTQSLHLSIMLPIRDQAGLDAFLKQLYDSQSPSYRQYLSVSEFTERFGAAQYEYDAVSAYAKANGLTVTHTYANRLVLEVTGSVASVEKAFNVNMGVYQHPTENREFFAADREPTVNIPVKLWHVDGLDNYSIPHSLAKHSDAISNTTGSGPGGQFLGSDMRVAYYGGTKLTGAGQSVGIFELGPYNPSDVTLYFTTVDQPLNVTVTPIGVGGASPTCSTRCDDTEEALDIEESISMAPGLSSVRVYVGANSISAIAPIFTQIATDNISKQISSSWTWDVVDNTTLDPIFEEFAAQGQNLFTASGDDGSYSSSTPYVYPADDPYVTAVGATDLTTVSAGGAWKSETAWDQSGGGISPTDIPIPAYQQTVGVITTANKGSLLYRNSPDVAMEGNEDNYICYEGLCEGGWGGTSFAAPRWAGYMALVNQLRVGKGLPTLGFINPDIYKIGLSSIYGTDFHDITSGSNGAFTAVTGYDLVTGWGSPHNTGLINTLAP